MKKWLLLSSLLAFNAYACGCEETAVEAARAAVEAAAAYTADECYSDKFCEIFINYDNSYKYGIKDINGNITLPAEYDYIYAQNDVFVVQKNYIYGLLDKTGKLAWLAGYESIDEMNGNFVGKKMGYTLLNNQGQKISPTYNDISKIDEDKMVFCQATTKKACGIMDKHGKVVLPAKYVSIQPIVSNYESTSLVSVRNDQDRFALLDTSTNKFLTAFEYDKIDDAYDDMLAVTIGDKIGFIDTKGKKVIAPIYDETGVFIHGLTLVKSNDENFYINKQGKRVN